MFKQAIELIRKYDTVIIHRHSNPDGDAIGSQYGLKQLILNSYPDKKATGQNVTPLWTARKRIPSPTKRTTTRWQ